MKIMTWNTALTEGSDATAVINYVKEFLDKEDDTIAVLQQIPYKIPDKDEKWKKAIVDPSYMQFDRAFPEDKYSVSKNTTFNFSLRISESTMNNMPMDNNHICFVVLNLPSFSTNSLCSSMYVL